MDVKLAIERIIVWDLDGVTFWMEVIKLHIAALEPLTKVASHLGGVGHIMINELSPDGHHHHQVWVWLKLVCMDGHGNSPG